MAVDPDALLRAAARFATLGAEVGDVVSRLRSAVDAEGACWGADETGAAFAEGYVAASGQVRESLVALPNTVDRVAAALVTAADNAVASEGAVAARFAGSPA
jgi:uncharacterized protein YukE